VGAKKNQWLRAIDVLLAATALSFSAPGFVVLHEVGAVVKVGNRLPGVFPLDFVVFGTTGVANTANFLDGMLFFSQHSDAAAKGHVLQQSFEFIWREILSPEKVVEVSDFLDGYRDDVFIIARPLQCPKKDSMGSVDINQRQVGRAQKMFCQRIHFTERPLIRFFFETPYTKKIEGVHSLFVLLLTIVCLSKNGFQQSLCNGRLVLFQLQLLIFALESYGMFPDSTFSFSQRRPS